MAKDSSPLADAAAEFDKELAAYARLGKLFIETPLGSVKYLERANTTLNEIAQCEERLQLAGQTLVRALSASRSQQEQLAKDVVAHVPNLQARNERLKELMVEMGAVASDVAGLNDLIAGKKDNGDATRGPTQADALDVSQTVLGLSTRAEALATAANAAEFEEVATQAHSLHQRLQAIGKKLQKAGGGAEA
jgi:DNA anti-recombination protein RmuC